MSNRQIVAATLAVLALVVVVLAWRQWHAFNVWEHQVRTTVVLNQYRTGITRYRGEHGRLPTSLELIPQPFRNAPDGADVDDWGFPVVYETNGVDYVLASVGADGARHTDDYWSWLAAVRESSYTRVCHDSGADYLVSTAGWHQGCGK